MASKCLKTHAVFAKATVVSVKNITNEVFSLTIALSKNSDCPLPGQFFMLRAIPSQVLLYRPISVFDVEKNKADEILVTFLILKRGKGTLELFNLTKSSSIDFIGPLGNVFPSATSILNQEKASCKNKVNIAIIGGGIGVAPVASFATTLDPNSYDFYACFRSTPYGLNKISPNTLTITTDDGSSGIKGILPNVFSCESIIQKKYKLVYACGPEMMLRYVKQECEKANIACYISLESKMACGVGACLGCSILTTDGNRRCCVDGPVFQAEKIIFKDLPPKQLSQISEKSQNNSVQGKNVQDLSVTIAGVTFQNPVIAASGTFGYGSEYSSLIDVNRLGGICSKGLTVCERPGNTGVRLHETSSGLINSIGLENPGIHHFIEYELQEMLSFKAKTIVNLSGSTIESYVEGASLLQDTAVPMIELNISCPNVKAGGMAFGMECNSAFAVVDAVRKATTKPLMVKLSPNAPDLVSVAMAAKDAGADALSLVNTFQGMAVDIEKKQFVFDNIRAGFSGPAIKPIALRMVFDVIQAMNKLPESSRIPVVALGGISCWQDAIEFLMVGASAIQVGTSTFSNPACMIEIIDGISAFLKNKSLASIKDIRMIF